MLPCDTGVEGAGGLHQQVLGLQVLHPAFCAEGVHGLAGRVVFLVAVGGAGHADANKLELLLGVAADHFVADGCRHRGVDASRDSQNHGLEVVVGEILGCLSHHRVEYFLVIHCACVCVIEFVISPSGPQCP